MDSHLLHAEPDGEQRAASGTAGIAVVALGVFTIIDSHRITVPLSANVVGPRVFPYAVGVALVLSGAAVLVSVLRGGRRAGVGARGDGALRWRGLGARRLVVARDARRSGARLRHRGRVRHRA